MKKVQYIFYQTHGTCTPATKRICCWKPESNIRGLCSVAMGHISTSITINNCGFPTLDLIITNTYYTEKTIWLWRIEWHISNNKWHTWNEFWFAPLISLHRNHLLYDFPQKVRHTNLPYRYSSTLILFPFFICSGWLITWKAMYNNNFNTIIRKL